MKRIALTGLKPTGSPHIGNYLGMIKPALELVHDFQALYFIPDYHALTTVRDREQLSSLIYESSAAWLALVLSTWTKLNLYFSPQLFGPQSVTSVV